MPFPSTPFPALALGDFQAGSCHAVALLTTDGTVIYATLFFASTCGSVQVSVSQKQATGVSNFRPESLVYQPLNRSVAGHVIVPVQAPADPTFVATVTFTNNSGDDGEGSLYVAVDSLNTTTQVILAERRKIPAGAATAFHIVFFKPGS
jgi:hypothetical protein